MRRPPCSSRSTTSDMILSHCKQAQRSVICSLLSLQHSAMQSFWIHITKFASSYSYPYYFYVKVLSILSQISFTRTFKAEPFFLSNYFCKWSMLNQSVNIGKLGFNWKSDKESYVRSSLWVVNVWGKHFKLPQLTHESFLTIDHSCKIFFDIC